MAKFTKYGKPIGYVLGVSPGFSRAAPVEQQLARMGLARKLATAARFGFEFAMVDFEELGEALEPGVVEQINLVRKANNIELGIHLPVWMDLTRAYTYEWRMVQEHLRVGTECAGRCGAKWILFHSSPHPRPNVTAIFGRPEPRMQLVGPDGTNFGDWIEKVGLKDWFMAKFIKILFNALGVAGDPAVITYFENRESFKKASEEARNVVEKAWEIIMSERAELQRRLDEIRVRLSTLERKRREEGLTTEEVEEYRRLLEEARAIALKLEETGMRNYLLRKIAEIARVSIEEAKTYHSVDYYLRSYNFYEIYDYWRRRGSEGEEYVAYLTVAKWLHKNKDKLWKYIVKTDEDPYSLCRRAIREMGKTAKVPQYIKQIVAAVAGAYIRGHLFAKGEQYGIKVERKGGKTEYISVYDYCKEKGMCIYIETAMPERGAEGELRIMSALDHINICKAIDGGKLVNYCMDFEHLLVNLIDPIKEAERILKEQPGDAKFVTCLHINAPRPLIGAHAPIELPSPDLAVIYRFVWTLRKAGMKDAYFIWEMGSYGVKQSAIAFWKIVKELEKGTHPDELPPEFYGITRDFEARTRVAVQTHALEPLKGLLLMPEVEWGILSKRARERGRLTQWEMEKYR